VPRTIWWDLSRGARQDPSYRWIGLSSFASLWIEKYLSRQLSEDASPPAHCQGFLCAWRETVFLLTLENYAWICLYDGIGICEQLLPGFYNAGAAGPQCWLQQCLFHGGRHTLWLNKRVETGKEIMCAYQSDKIVMSKGFISSINAQTLHNDSKKPDKKRPGKGGARKKRKT